MRRIVSPSMNRNPAAAEEARRAMIKWAQNKLPLVTFTPWATAIGVTQRNKLIAVVVFDRFEGWQCEIAIASDGKKQWLMRGLLQVGMDYVFRQLRLERVMAMVSADNDASIRLCEKLGMVREGCLRRARPHPDVIIFGALQSDFQRFVRPGERYARAA